MISGTGNKSCVKATQRMPFNIRIEHFYCLVVAPKDCHPGQGNNRRSLKFYRPFRALHFNYALQHNLRLIADRSHSPQVPPANAGKVYVRAKWSKVECRDSSQLFDWPLSARDDLIPLITHGARCHSLLRNTMPVEETETERERLKSIPQAT